MRDLARIKIVHHSNKRHAVQGVNEKGTLNEDKR